MNEKGYGKAFTYGLRAIIVFGIALLVWNALFARKMSHYQSSKNPYNVNSTQQGVIDDWLKDNPNTPNITDLKFCQLVGTWVSSRGEKQLQIQLKDDASFDYIQIKPADKLDVKGTGKWRFAEGSLIWEYMGGHYDNNPVFALDIHRDKLYTFKLVEQNGDVTNFERDLKQENNSDSCKD